MSIRIVVKKNTYFDSVSLMSISTRANKLDGVEQAFVAMATEMNKGVLKNLGLLTPELEEAKSGDLMIVIKGASDEANAQTLVAIDDLFTHKEQGGQHEARYATLASAKKHVPDSNLAVISVNGLFAAREARQALQNNLNVMLFSDNVSLEDELTLKQLAHEKGLLMMGPDCGTAIINGAALCFGNAVRRGNIGIIGASGTGSQELSVRIHEFGGGISQLIGTGGRDLSEKIGGLMMLDAIGCWRPIRKLRSSRLSPNLLRQRWRARCWNVRAPVISPWWCVSSDVKPRLRMKKACSLPAVLKRRR
jgi:succinyl-CoA synthetase alpha subunit